MNKAFALAVVMALGCKSGGAKPSETARPVIQSTGGGYGGAAYGGGAYGGSAYGTRR